MRCRRTRSPGRSASTRRSGSSAAEVARRAAASGPNELEEAPRTSIARLFWEALTEPFVILLIVAGVLAVALGEVRDGLLVLLALLPIVGADVVTGYRGEKALDALRAASAPAARVRRDETVDDVAAAGLVAGDVVLLRAGDVVPADLRLVRADRLVVDRSVLTGESVPEPAGVAADPPDARLPDRRSMAYAGTSIVGGRGEGVVVAIGGATEVGRIASGLGVAEEHRSPLQRELDRLVRILLVVAIGLIAIVTGLGFARGQEAGANLLAGISAAIAAIPEEPPILLAVILGLGAYRLLRRDVLVRRLNAEETLGAIDLIITDKTGTLTRNRLDVVSVRDLAGPDRRACSARRPARWVAGRGRRLGPRRGHAAGLVHRVARSGDRGSRRGREPRPRRPRLVRARHRRPADLDHAESRSGRHGRTWPSARPRRSSR